LAVFGPTQKALDAARDKLRAGLTMVAVGWVLLIFDSIPAVWIWTGWRSGGMFWFWYVTGLGTVGATLVLVGSLLRSHAGKQIARFEADTGVQEKHEGEVRAA
jgi:hypothetical protein